MTSDGPIVAGYRLMERTAMRMERWSFALLPGALRELEVRIDERSLALSAETIAAAARRAHLVIAVARLLIGEQPAWLDAEGLAQARACAALVEKAEGRSMPRGSGPPTRGGLVSSGRPSGPGGPMRARSGRSARSGPPGGFEAVPFRLERDEELAALWLIQKAKWNINYWPSPMWAKGLMPVSEESSVFADAFLRDNDDDGLGVKQLEALARGPEEGPWSGASIRTCSTRSRAETRCVSHPACLFPRNRCSSSSCIRTGGLRSRASASPPA